MAAEGHFAELLRRHRRAVGYSQETLAERARLSVGAISALEQGVRRAPYRDTVAALADALDISGTVRHEFEEAAARARARQPRTVSALPASLTSFIERSEVDELNALLTERRLTTITGPGGVGKTRIAIEVARRTEHLYDETGLVDLLPIRDGSMVASQIAMRLDVPVEGDDGLSGIANFLRPRKVLLLIDNCEHVVADAAKAIESLLLRCPSLTVLATSREALALSAELAFRLPAMDAKTALDLFVARAQLADRTLPLDAKHLAVIAEICKQLEGIPLAIELAATRVATLGLDAVRTRLKGGLTLTGGRDLPDRHRTIDATIAWSYDLLDDKERLLFRRLSVFVCFRLEAAEEVCADELLPASIIADTVSQLVQKSLISAERIDTSTRYRLLDSIRTFASERLAESGEREYTMLRFIEWLKRQTAVLDSSPPASADVLVGNRVELDNVHNAVRWAESVGNYDAIVAAAQILIGFRRVWYGTSREAELHTLGVSLLKLLREDENPELAGRLMHAMAQTLVGDELLDLARRAIPLLKRSGHNARAADLHGRAAIVESSRGDFEAAEYHLASGAALLTSELRSSPQSINFTINGAYARRLMGDFTHARACLETLEVPQALFHLKVSAQIVLAEIESGDGNLDKAIEILASVRPELSDYPDATPFEIQIFGNLARYELRLGDVAAAKNHLREALSRAVELHDPGMLYVTLSFTRFAATIAALSGRFELAARLLGACDAAEKRSGQPSENTDDVAAAAIVEHLSRQRAEALRSRGAGEDLYELLEEFLAQPAATDSARLSATSSP